MTLCSSSSWRSYEQQLPATQLQPKRLSKSASRSDPLGKEFQLTATVRLQNFGPKRSILPNPLCLFRPGICLSPPVYLTQYLIGLS